LLAIAFALAAGGCWGISDFTGGLLSRRLSTLVVLLTIELSGLVVLLGILAATGEGPPPGGKLLVALAAGAAGILGLGVFYRALAIGTMSIVAPISATGSAIPVVVGVATGDTLTLLIGLGLALTMAGVVLASREKHEAQRVASRSSIVLALLAALGFGSFFVLYDSASDDSLLWAMLCIRGIAVPLVGGLILRHRPAAPGPRDLGILAIAGLLDLTATGLYALANREGALSIVGVVGSLYPIATVLLARVILGERIRPVQQAGVVLAFAGVGLISAGTA
jgi:drug/metabolite transporter (DMT)-like permease